MPISTDQWCVDAGLFGAHRYAAIIKVRLSNIQL